MVAFEAARNLCLGDLQQRVYFEHRHRVTAIANDKAGAVKQVGHLPQRFGMA